MEYASLICTSETKTKKQNRDGNNHSKGKAHVLHACTTAAMDWYACQNGSITGMFDKHVMSTKNASKTYLVCIGLNEVRI